MTNSKLTINDNQYLYAFSHTERPYIQALTERANSLLIKIQNKSNTKEEKREYTALKWALKELGAIDKEKTATKQE